MISKLRFTTGILVFAVGQSTTLLIPFVASSTLTTEWKTILSSIFLFVLPQTGILLAIVILGKPGYEKLKTIIFSWVKKYTGFDNVSRTRYNIGLVLFLVPILFDGVSPYFGHLIPTYTANKLIFAITTDCMLIISFFVLGGEFWEKIKLLFIYNVKNDTKIK